MSGNIKPDPMAGIQAFEAAAFRVGQLARRLRIEHPDLPVERMEPTVWVLATGDGPDVHAELEISPGSVDAVRAWAVALGTEATVTVSASTPYERAVASSVIDGVTVKADGSRALTGDEYTAWRARQDQAAAVAGGEL